MNTVWVRPTRAEDLPLLREWMVAQRETSPFEPALAKGALVLVAYDESGVLGFFPAWPSLSAGCPLEREGLSEVTRARMAVAVVGQLAFLAERHGAAEVSTAVNDRGVEHLLSKLGFKAAGKLMRRRNGV